MDGKRWEYFARSNTIIKNIYDNISLNAKDNLPYITNIKDAGNPIRYYGSLMYYLRDKSIQLINDANKGDKVIGVVAQRDEDVEDPTSEDIYKTGVVAQILRVLKMPDGNTTVIIQGKKRFQINELIQGLNSPIYNPAEGGVPDGRFYAVTEKANTIISFLMKYRIKKSNGVLAVGIEAKNFYKKFHSNVINLPYSISVPNKIRKNYFYNKKINFTYVGQIIKRKGIDVFSKNI